MKRIPIINAVVALVWVVGLARSPKEIGHASSVENLQTFAKLYGYVRWFHPSDEASQINWDKFAVYGASKVKSATSRSELKQILEELFLPLAPTGQIYFSEETPRPFQIEAKDSSKLKRVAWQHRGVGLGNQGPYLSVRLNREYSVPAGQGFGTISQTSDAAKYQGREIKLRARVRTDLQGPGQAQLWLHVERQDGRGGFFDNMDDRPIRNPQWQSYEILGQVDQDATKIAFGCFLRGLGKVWVDEFELFFRNKANEWESIRIQNPGFEEDDQQVKGWWAASRGYAYKIENQNAYSGNRAVLIEHAIETRVGQLFEQAPSVGEVIDKEIGRGLREQIPLALWSDERSTLGRSDRYPFESLRAEVEKVDLASATATTEDVRLAGLVIAWNIFQHFYPYFDVVRTDWEGQFRRFLEKAFKDKNEADFLLTLKEFIAQLEDGHGRVNHSRLDQAMAGLPMLVELVEDKVTVVASADTDRFQCGDVIKSIDGVPAEERVRASERYISGSRQWKRLRALRAFSSGPEGSVARLEIERRDKLIQVEAVRNHKVELSERVTPALEEIRPGIYYVDLTRAQMSQIQARMSDLVQARGVVFDFRGYPRGGNHEILQHLTDQPIESAIWMVPQFIYPDRERIVGYDTSGRWRVEPKKPRLKGKTVFLTNAAAISYAESVMGIVEHYKLGEIVGQATAGANGNVNPFRLPGGYWVSWTGMKVLKHDRSQHHLVGIQPTVPVTRTLKAVREGRDEYLEKALDVVNQVHRPELTGAAARAQRPRIGVIDFYGLRTISETHVRSKLPFKEGDALPEDLDSFEADLAAKLQIDRVEISAVCCDRFRNFIVWLGIQDTPISDLAFHPAPRGETKLPPEVLVAYRRFGSAMFEALRGGNVPEDLTQGHSLVENPSVREVQEIFVLHARQHLETLRRVLHDSANAEHRAAAAWVLGYAQNKKDVVEDLQQAVQDPDEAVRNNATRALAAIAVLAELRPELKIKIRPDIFIKMLNSVVWTDRNKALMMLTRLTKSRDRKLMDQIRKKALPSLIEMSRWKSDPHAVDAYIILGRIVGLSDEEISTTWNKGEREKTIAKTLLRY